MHHPEIECVPPGDFAYLRLGKCSYGKGRMLFFTWEQVEYSSDDTDRLPMFTATLAERDLLRLAKAALLAAGNDLYLKVVVPENDWGKEDTDGE